MGEAFEDARAVGVGLEAADEPGAGIAEGAVVEVHRVLGGEDEADAECAGLFHEGDERALGGWVRGMRRKEAVEFVEDDERAEVFAAGKSADVGEELFEDDAEDERAFVVVEVRDADDDGRRATVARGEPGLEVEVRAFAPAREGWGREERVQGGCEFDTPPTREEALDG
ncbi:MAG TPA: hypothetical protein VMI54_20805 [Polyangiaceae bacterium]|nr:hypothetical protein [Polyangiaceae bacterium]